MRIIGEDQNGYFCKIFDSFIGMQYVYSASHDSLAAQGIAMTIW